MWWEVVSRSGRGRPWPSADTAAGRLVPLGCETRWAAGRLGPLGGWAVRPAGRLGPLGGWAVRPAGRLGRQAAAALGRGLVRAGPRKIDQWSILVCLGSSIGQCLVVWGCGGRIGACENRPVVDFGVSGVEYRPLPCCLGLWGPGSVGRGSASGRFWCVWGRGSATTRSPSDQVVGRTALCPGASPGSSDPQPPRPCVR